MYSTAQSLSIRGIGGFGALQICNTILELRLVINIDFVEFLQFRPRLFCVKRQGGNSDETMHEEEQFECRCEFNPFTTSLHREEH